jgi:hypothetical protein
MIMESPAKLELATDGLRPLFIAGAFLALTQPQPVVAQDIKDVLAISVAEGGTVDPSTPLGARD